ncbi:DNA-(apurinic or apyrimidinic site) lyase 2 [Colletotrichum sp. SAR 10_70]|nr:DNA-(apurinic or apyrimidinic site) lyase 2 [Colletotrichum sp. SAR 10_71]KAI8171671.1 DNA-(apurinic or apyrimidinic site) lyase 2 [Colletotrichum sp. SAR 10_70]
MGLRIVTWNVNGIRNPFGYQPWREKRTYQAMFDILEADIVIMQECKIQRKDLTDEMVLVPGWDVFFSLPKHKKGYSGVAIYTRNATCAPIRAEEGILGVLTPPGSSTPYRDLPPDQHIGGYPRAGQLSSEVDDATLDSEGRCVVLEFPAFVLIGTYSPATRDSSRDDFRLGYLNALDVRVRNLIAQGKEVILTGDLNVILEELDTCNLREMLRKEGMTVEDWKGMPSRRIFNQLVVGGNVTGARGEGREKPVLHDLTRIFHPTRQGMFTCWDTKRNTRPANNGSRIDYILCSSGIKDWFTDSNIQEGLMGSDHCPVYAIIGDVVNKHDKDVPIVDLMNPSDMFRQGDRLREWAAKDLLPLSAKLIPEFDKRRSIRDMFMKKPTTKPTTDTPPPSIPKDTPSQQPKSPSFPNVPDDPPSQTFAPSNTSKIPPTVPDRTLPPSSSAPVKRQAEAKDTKRSLKRTKTNDNDSKTNKQSTLTGFFKPKAPAAKPTGAHAESEIIPDSSDKNNGPEDQSQENKAAVLVGSLSTVAEVPATAESLTSPLPSKQQQPASTLDLSATETSEKVFDPIETKEAWSKFSLGKRVVPKCEHGEPCVSFQTKKPGINCGEIHPSNVFLIRKT